MNQRVKETSSALILSIATAGLLAALKFATGILTNSMAIIASALDSMLDVATSSVNLIASRKAAKPPDEDHAYGHEKIESLAGLFQSLLIAISGSIVFYESIRRLITGSILREIPLGIGVMIFSIAVTGLLSWRLEAVGRKHGSLILATEKLHFSMDFFTHAGALLALFLVRSTGIVLWDLLVSIAVCGYIFKTAYGICRQAVDELLDRSLPPVSKEEIEKIILNFHPAVVSFHNFRSRRVGEQIFMDFHIEIRGERDFKRAHAMTEGLIKKIQETYPRADVTVHYDPEGEN
jgi:ferrous-iron efflux pump FieF